MNNFMQPNPYQQIPRMGNTMLWVQGIEGGKAFQLAPNSNAVLFDSENDGVFYIKTSDNVGMCNLRIFKYEEVTNTQTSAQTVNLDAYVRKDELQELIKGILHPEVKDNEQTVSADASTTNGTKSLITF